MNLARSALALMLLNGASCARPVVPLAPVTAATPPAQAHTPLPASTELGPSTRARSCDGRAPGVFSFASAADLTCADAHRDCHGALEIEVLNCTAASVTLDPIAVTRPGGQSSARAEYVPSSPLAPGASLAFHPTVSHPGGYAITVVVLAGDRTDVLPTINLEIANPALTRALAACTACNGRWGREGMLGLEGCNCRPSDAGNICHDGDECEGVCLPDGVEVITKARPLTCDARGKCSASIGTGRLVGHCSDRVVVFGCHGEIPRGASKQPPAWLPVHGASICVD